MSESSSPLLIGLRETHLLADAAVFADDFRSRHALVCADAVDRPFLKTLLRLTGTADFVHDTVDHVGQRELESPNRAGAALTLALRRPGFIRWVEEVTQCGPLDTIDGRVAQIRAVPGQHLGWHDDLNVPERRLALTIDLSENPFEGGLFELREKGSKDTLFRFRHAMPGSLLIFELSPRLEHRVLPLTSGGPRRNYAGWFLKKSKP